MDALVLVLLVLSAFSALAFGWRRDQLVRAALVAASLFGLVWAATIGLALSGWRDADGFVDCYPDCSGLQNATGVLFFWTPPTVIILLVIAVASWLLARRRHRRAAASRRRDTSSA